MSHPIEIDPIEMKTSLDDELIERYNSPKSPVVIFWGINEMHFFSITTRQHNIYTEEMNLVKSWKNTGKITNVSMDEYSVSGITLFVLELEFKNHPCDAYKFMRGFGDEIVSTKTPYFFRYKKLRDRIFKWLDGKYSYLTIVGLSLLCSNITIRSHIPHELSV